MNQTRVTRLQQEMKTKALDGVILMPGPNQIYFSHMHTHISERPILLFLPAAGAPAAIAEVCDMLLRTDPLGYAGCCAAIRDMDMRPVLPLVRKAALVIAGLQDPATPPEHADIMMRLLPDASLVTLDAAHLSNIEQPALFADAVLEFVMKSIVC